MLFSQKQYRTSPREPSSQRWGDSSQLSKSSENPRPFPLKKLGIQEVPDFLAIGHVTQDIQPDGDWRLGGSVAFAALTASRLGLRSAVVTSGTGELLAELTRTLPDVQVSAIPSEEATTFENVYTDGVRRQYLRGRAATISLDAVPESWRAAPMILLAPLIGEVEPEVAAELSRPRSALLAATPQGWLRSTDSIGRVSPAPFDMAERILPSLQAMILSYEDVVVDAMTPGAVEQAHALISDWARIVPLVVVTRGAAGALLYQEGRWPKAFPGYPAHEVDPTGAGDVYAGAFMVQLYRTGNPAAAMDFANRVAACSVEALGVGGIPTYEEALARFADSIDNEDYFV
jgi:1D-myo-inositol 3-kinase